MEIRRQVFKNVFNFFAVAFFRGCQLVYSEGFAAALALLRRLAVNKF